MEAKSGFTVLGYKVEKKDFIIFWLLVILLFSYRACKSHEEVNEGYISGYNTLQKEKKTWIDKEGHYNSKIETLTSDNIAFLLEGEHKDSTIQKLTRLVDKYKKDIKKQGSITIIHTEGEVEGSSITVVDTTKQEVKYTSDFNFKGWVWGSTIATKDSTHISFKYKDEFNIVVGEEKTGFLGLGKSKPYSLITSKSPYTTVKEQKTYQTTLPPPKKFGVGFIAGYTLGPQFTIAPSVGVGVSYNFIRF